MVAPLALGLLASGLGLEFGVMRPGRERAAIREEERLSEQARADFLFEQEQQRMEQERLQAENFARMQQFGGTLAQAQGITDPSQISALTQAPTPQLAAGLAAQFTEARMANEALQAQQQHQQLMQTNPGYARQNMDLNEQKAFNAQSNTLGTLEESMEAGQSLMDSIQQFGTFSSDVASPLAAQQTALANLMIPGLQAMLESGVLNAGEIPIFQDFTGDPVGFLSQAGPEMMKLNLLLQKMQSTHGRLQGQFNQNWGAAAATRALPSFNPETAAEAASRFGLSREPPAGAESPAEDLTEQQLTRRSRLGILAVDPRREAEREEIDRLLGR